ncbi:aminotransferase class IV [Marinospirillum sp. MEB164]|uniref:Aminotransferase class IV n=1 Tax=Marinospirillum alkalitolerans TaxID=3123374 RepID=A0ABW8PYZ5_9GAMM
MSLLLLDGRAPLPSDLDWLLASRALAFGEGLFTSVRLWQQQPLFWPDHQQRLQKGLDQLGVSLDASLWQSLEQEVMQLAQQQGEGRLKVMLLAGPGGQGYARQQASLPWHRLVHAQPMQIEPSLYLGQPVWWLACPASGPHSETKHLNRLSQVLAADACPAPYREALLYSAQGEIKEGIARNLFWRSQGRWYTPCLGSGALAGVMRRQLIRLLGVEVAEVKTQLIDLQQADEIFLCNSVQGIWPITRLDHAGGTLAHWSVGRATLALMADFHPQMGLPVPSSVSSL